MMQLPVTFHRAVSWAQCESTMIHRNSGRSLLMLSCCNRPCLLRTERVMLLLFLLPKFTGEKFGQVEKTELDAHFENLLSRADSTKNWTEKIFRQTEVLLQPNPSKARHTHWTDQHRGLHNSQPYLMQTHTGQKDQKHIRWKPMSFFYVKHGGSMVIESIVL